MNSFLRVLLSLSVLLAGLLVAASAPAAADTVLESGETLPLSSYAAHVVDESRGRIYISAGPGDDRLAVTDLTGHPVQTVNDLPGASSMALSADGTSLFVALETHRVVRLDTETLSVAQTYLLSDVQRATNLTWAGDRLGMVIVSNCCTEVVQLLDPTTGEQSPVAGPQGAGLVLTSTASGRLVVFTRSTQDVRLVDPASGAVVTTRHFIDQITQIQTSTTGQPYAIGNGTSHWGRLEFLDPDTLETLHSTRVATLSSVDTDGTVVVSSLGSDWYGARGVEVRDTDTSSRLNSYRLADVPGQSPVTLASILTSAGLVVLHQESEIVAASHVNDLSVMSTTLGLEIPFDAYIGREITITGVLTDRGAPIPGAEVRITDEPGAADGGTVRTRLVTTAEDGTFAFSYTSRTWNDLITLEYAGDEVHPAAWQQVHGFFDLQPTELSLDYPSSPAPGEPITFVGTLTALGDPVSGVTVEVDHWCTDTSPVTVRTDETGRFEVTVTPGRCESDQFSFFYAASSPYENAWETRVVQPTWQKSNLTLVQPREAAVAGSTWVWEGTAESAGSALPDVPITYTIRRDSTGTLVASGNSRTDAVGGFSISETLEGADRYTLVARYEGTAVMLGDSATDQFQVTRIPTRLSLSDSQIEVLPDQAITIGGRVTTPDGTAIADHPVEISQNGAMIAPFRTDADGRFEFQTVPRPPESSSDNLRLYVVKVVETPRYAGTQLTVRVTVAPEPTRLILDAVPTRSVPGDAVRLGGRLLNSSGEPLVGREVVLTHNDGESTTLRAVTDEQGHFDVDTVIKTGYWQYLTAGFAGTRVLAPSYGYANWESIPLPGVLNLNKVPTRLLGESVSLTGRLTASDGRGEASWVTFHRVDEAGQVEWSYDPVRTASDGTFSLNVAADQVGRFTFTARSSLWRVAPQSDSIVVDIRRLQLRTNALRPDAVVRGWSVYDADRNPLLRTATAPARSGLCVAHEVQRLFDDTWRPVTTPQCRDTNEAGTLSQRLGVRHPAGSRFRVRAVRESQIVTVGGWELLRFR